MKRRSFLGFAVGGVVAAPAAILVGEKPVGYLSGAPGPELVNSPKAQQVTVTVIGTAEGDAHVRRIIQGEIRRAMDERDRGGFSYYNRKSGPGVEFLNPSSYRG
ncbi:hypothetical protein [Ensifer sp. OTU672]|uniref:hypothetical protein n=1 Tax=Ensifer sp. OTU672 TaxID=3043861 RepID=UPI00313E6379